MTAEPRPLIIPTRVWVGEPYKVDGRKKKPWRVDWRVNDKRKARMFTSRKAGARWATALADAVDAGEKWDRFQLLPASLAEVAETTILDVAIGLCIDKWAGWEDQTRRSSTDFISRVLTELVRTPFEPTDKRRATTRAAFRYVITPEEDRRDKDAPTPELRAWIHRNTLTVSEITPKVHDAAIGRAFVALNGRVHAESVQANIRSNGMSALMTKAVRDSHLSFNLTSRSDAAATIPVAHEFDPKDRYLSREQYEALRAEYIKTGPMGRHLALWLDLMYHCGLRPSEALAARPSWFDFPDKDSPGAWGTLFVASAIVQPGRRWATDADRKPSGSSSGEKRRLKWRAHGVTRPVPVPPNVVATARQHIEKYSVADDDLLFRSSTGTTPDNLPRRFRKARRRAFGEDDPRHHHAVAKDLRHSSVSNQLSAGADPDLVADNHGHDVEVMRRFYRKVVDDPTIRTAQAMSHLYDQ